MTDQPHQAHAAEPGLDKRRLTTIFVTVFIDVLGFGLILPLLPYYATEFGAGPAAIGLLTAAYPAAQIFAAPLLGRLSDRYGRRPVLILSILGTAVSFVILGLANTLLLLFVGRILDGITGANFIVAQSYIADVTTAKDRARGLGLTGAAFGLGFIIGPAVGGLLSTISPSMPAFVAAGIALLNAAQVYFLLPESLTAERKAELAAKPKEAVTLASLLAALRRPLFGEILTVRFGFGLAFGTFQTIFSLWGLTALNLDAPTIGLLLAYVGVLSAVVQFALIAPLTKRYSEGLLLVVTLGLSGVFLAVWGFSPNIVALMVVLTPLCFAIGIQNTVSQSILSKSVSPTEIGGAFGLSSSLQSVGSIVAPIVGGVILGSIGVWSPGVLAGLVCLALVPFAWTKFAKPGTRFAARPQDDQQADARPAETAGGPH